MKKVLFILAAMVMVVVSCGTPANNGGNNVDSTVITVDTNVTVVDSTISVTTFDTTITKQ